MTKPLTLTDGWATPAQLAQIAQDYRAAVALIDKQGWAKHISDGDKDGKPICAARAIGIVTGVGSWDSFAGRAPLALSACFRYTKMLLTQVNDKAGDWADAKGVMLGIAEACEHASTTRAVLDA